MRVLAITSVLFLAGCAAVGAETPSNTLAELDPATADSRDRRFVGKWVADFEGAGFEEEGSGQLYLIEAPEKYEEFLFPIERRFHEPTEDFDYECFFVTLVAMPVDKAESGTNGVPTLLFRKLETYSIPAPEDRDYYSCLEGLQ